ncbi:MAG TPA: M20 family metallopeptidase [Clostridia bacterium]|nr:M20 family metallopeptidase [Clostridia bacterium]
MILLDKNVRGLKDEIIGHRRWLHRNPEIGFDVYDTRDYILDRLGELKFDEVKILAKTGIKAVMKGKVGSRTLAFRADMDALAIEEETNLEFASENKGFMHACGHDGHMSILLGFAKWLSDNREDLYDNIVLVFQPDEENEGGALPMIEEGLLNDPKVDAIFGLHIMPDLPQGRIGIKSGSLMAQTCEIDIELIGKSAHGAMPDKGIDTIVAAAHFINALQSIITRTIDPTESVVFSIGKIAGGDTRNILAEKVKLECTVRTFSDELYENLKGKVLDLLEGMEKSHGIKSTYQEGVYYPPVVNHEKWTNRLVEILPEEQYIEAKPLMIAEDFSNYQKEVPGVFVFLGSGNEEKGHVYPLHSNRFDFDEEILLQGVQLYVDIVNKA